MKDVIFLSSNLYEMVKEKMGSKNTIPRIVLERKIVPIYKNEEFEKNTVYATGRGVDILIEIIKHSVKRTV